ncbi:MAG TPA: hypothetical protein VJ777_27020 [Mycobacterium sp.]|nr:hypothetical protein [Mycobacterium sp.]
MASLAFFTVTGTVNSVVVDYVDVDTHPDIKPVSAMVDFIPRLPRGSVIWSPGLTPPQGVMLPAIRARIDSDGILRTIVGGLGVELAANTPELGVDQLIYDVVFSKVVLNKSEGYIAPFAFEAPTGTATLDLATMSRLPPKSSTT